MNTLKLINTLEHAYPKPKYDTDVRLFKINHEVHIHISVKHKGVHYGHSITIHPEHKNLDGHLRFAMKNLDRSLCINRDQLITCWSCKEPLTKMQRALNDGHCIHCKLEIEQ